MLETRRNAILSDRLAVIANLGAYERRIDKAALEKTDRGFGTAVLVLSLIKGDRTLLSGYGECFLLCTAVFPGTHETTWISVALAGGPRV